MIANAPIGPHPVTRTRLPSNDPARHDGVQDDGKGLGKGSLVDGDAVGDLVALPGFSDETLAKGALNMRHRHRAAVKAHVQALVLLALQAIVASVAGPARRNRDAVTDRKPRYRRTQRLDGPGNLMTEDHGLAHPHGAEAAMVEIMQIRSADAAGLDGDLDLATCRTSTPMSAIRGSTDLARMHPKVY
jgi:hypothetical protein